MKINKKIIQELTEYLKEFNLTEIEYAEGTTKVKVSRGTINTTTTPSEVKKKKETLKTRTTFLKRQVAKNIVSNSTLAQALVPVVKSLEGGISFNDLSVLEALNSKATDAIRDHGLVNQYTEVQNLMAMAQAAQRNKAEVQKLKKEEEKRLAAKKKTAALVAAKRAKERAAKRKREDAFAKKLEKYLE